MNIVHTPALILKLKPWKLLAQNFVLYSPDPLSFLLGVLLRVWGRDYLAHHPRAYFRDYNIPTLLNIPGICGSGGPSGHCLF